jgi:hypothetical protein
MFKKGHSIQRSNGGFLARMGPLRPVSLGYEGLSLVERKTTSYIAVYIALISKWVIVDTWDAEISSEVQGDIKKTNKHCHKNLILLRKCQLKNYT